MGTQIYPGRGLSLSQLVFALNKELDLVVHSPSFTLDAISQLDRDTSAALTTIREWRNSLVPINRIPLDILSLIPTHLSSQEDRFIATSVCRHWRKTFLEHGALWSKLFLHKGNVYVETLLRRVKGSPLDVIVDRKIPTDTTITLLSPRIRQIKYLELRQSSWEAITKLSEMGLGQPFLRTLKIAVVERRNGFRRPVTPPPHPFFSDAANLEQFFLDSWSYKRLEYFVFPRLTTLTLSMHCTYDCNAPDLFDFLKASPMLRTVEIRIQGGNNLQEHSREPIVVLPNVEVFSLHMFHGWGVYYIAARISCPYSKHTSLTYQIPDYELLPGIEIFPTSVTSNVIVRQYTRSPVEEVTLRVEPIIDLAMGPTFGPLVGCSLTFRCSDTGIIKLGFQVPGIDLPQTLLEEIGCEAFLQASTTIRAHPLLCQVKHLHIEYKAITLQSRQLLSMAQEVGSLFKSLGPLDGLTIDGCDLHVVFFASHLELGELEQTIVFPSIKELAISRLPTGPDAEACMEAIVDLAESQHAKGIPFERVKIHATAFPAEIVEVLRRWVGAVDCYED
ncbi:hypothetical protein BJ322DRAFT_427364 [Thelephora terrestris]|uniref:F-box domain-containing protein n=1 Tax=Thelephora terrestris TaxID=56493 RepID=A0A9P6H2I6_9AGAM|nr:hypothetical protein BJ322DRAFT_572352 [Thelephora terrestris]KAF9791105.1 hypothetical protein BJ322DRAFT_427364 [Thelephora terrestris]